MQPEGPLTADAVENDFRELEQAFDMARRDPNGHFTTADRITLRDPDSAPPLIQEIRQQDVRSFSYSLLKRSIELWWFL